MERSEKNTELLKILNQRLASARSELAVQEAELKKLREPPILVRNDELIASLSYTIGYLNGVIYETELFIGLFNLTADQLKKYATQKKKIEKENSGRIERLISEVTEKRKKGEK